VNHLDFGQQLLGLTLILCVWLLQSFFCLQYPLKTELNGHVVKMCNIVDPALLEGKSCTCTKLIDLS